MTTTGHVFIPLDRAHDGTMPMDDDRAHFESLPVPLELSSCSPVQPSELEIG
jgi:hypothetical protein